MLPLWNIWSSAVELQTRPESTLPPRLPTDQGTKAKMVNSERGQAETPKQEDPHAFLLSDSEEEDSFTGESA